LVGNSSSIDQGDVDGVVDVVQEDLPIVCVGADVVHRKFLSTNILRKLDPKLWSRLLKTKINLKVKS
jgi:hypothetical protein